jgi:hypothetical protein
MNDLEYFAVRWPDDPAALNPRLVHLVCGTVLCDVEEGDTLSVLVSLAQDHVAQDVREDYGCPGAGEDAINHDTYKEQAGEDA